MKSLLVLFLALSSAAVAAPEKSAIDTLLGPALAGKADVYFRVVLERRNGIDMREYVMMKSIIQALEKEGASVRPDRSSKNVSYWIFFKNGDYASCDVVNHPESSNLPYAKLADFLSDAPHDGAKWSRDGDDLKIGQRYYSVRVLPADDPVTGGKKGEVEIAVIYGQEKVYYYFGNIVQP